jgi:GT2 family glycosyltransferase
MDVSVIIVNYNTKQLTINCINSVFEKTTGVSFEVILIDNASSDGSADYFRKDQRIVFIEGKENHGFGRANNMGMDVAKGKYLFLLNSDTILLNNAVFHLYVFAESKQDLKIGVLGTVLLDENWKESPSFGQFPSMKSIFDNLFRRLKQGQGYENKIFKQVAAYGFAKVDYISGADLFIPKTIIDQIGGFDPEIFMFYEETDLQKRIANAGYARIIMNSREIIHLVGGSFGRTTSYYRYHLMQKSLNVYTSKHFNTLRYLSFRLVMVFVTLKDIYIYHRNISSHEKLLVLKQAIWTK